MVNLYLIFLKNVQERVQKAQKPLKFFPLEKNSDCLEELFFLVISIRHLFYVFGKLLPFFFSFILI